MVRSSFSDTVFSRCSWVCVTANSKSVLVVKPQIKNVIVFFFNYFYSLNAFKLSQWVFCHNDWWCCCCNCCCCICNVFLIKLTISFVFRSKLKGSAKKFENYSQMGDEEQQIRIRGRGCNEHGESVRHKFCIRVRNSNLFSIKSYFTHSIWYLHPNRTKHPKNVFLSLQMMSSLIVRKILCKRVSFFSLQKNFWMKYESSNCQSFNSQ